VLRVFDPFAQYIEQHCEGKSAAEFEDEIRKVRTESAEIAQRTHNEHEKKVEELIAVHATEVQQIRSDCEKLVEQTKANRLKSIQQLEHSLEELESVTEKFDHDLKASEERNASAVERLQQSESSRNTVVTGLQYEVELLK